MTGTPAWAFLVARGYETGYQLLLAPEFLASGREAGQLMDEVRGEVPEDGPPAVTTVVAPGSGPLCVVHRTVRVTRADVEPSDAPLTDRAGRPLVLAYGFVTRGVRVATADDRDLADARAAAAATYRRFRAAEADFVPETSRSFGLRSAAAPIGRAGPAPPEATTSAPAWTSDVLPGRRPAVGRRRPVLPVGLVVGVVALLALALAGAYMWTGRDVVVPHVVGRQEEDARKRIRESGLVPVIEVMPAREPVGTVVATDPGAGKRVSKGSKLRMTVSTGSPPAVRGG